MKQGIHSHVRAGRRNGKKNQNLNIHMLCSESHTCTRLSQTYSAVLRACSSVFVIKGS